MPWCFPRLRTLFFLLAMLHPSPLLADAPAKIAGLVLINAKNGEELAALGDGFRINVASLPSRDINIRADTIPDRVEKVVFKLNRFQRFREETVRPYAMAGDKGGRYNSWKVQSGTNLLVVIPFLNGQPGIPLRVTFEVVDRPGAAAPVAAPQPALVAPSMERKLAPPVQSVSLAEEISQALILPTATPPPAPTPTLRPTPPPELLTFPLYAPGDRPGTVGPSLGECMVGLQSKQGALTMACIHHVTAPRNAVMQLGPPDTPGQVVCDFDQAESPMVTACDLTPLTVQALKRGELSIRVEVGEGNIAWIGGRVGSGR